jgi:bifunctional DNA-binding transcriptional regulator/antitoxin component of YhaV-PrlF toxin-antitoxin module
LGGNYRYFTPKRGTNRETPRPLFNSIPLIRQSVNESFTKGFDLKPKVSFDLKCFWNNIWHMTQTKISKAFQTTLSAEAIRRLGLRPGQRLNQIVNGNRLILEPVEDADGLAGSLGAKGKGTHTVEEMKAAARKAIAESGMAGSRVRK